MNNTLKKIVASITVLTCAGLLMGPGVAQALTVNELLALIAGASSLEDLQADIAAAQDSEDGEVVTIEGVPADFTFETNLKQTDTGDDVKYLQIVLNSDSDTQLAEEGVVGSAGNETSYFGPLTKAAVIAFQELYTEDCLASWGLTEGTGYVGSTTRAKLNELLGEVVPPTECTVDADCPAGYTCTAEVCVKISVAAGLTAALAATTPASTSIISYGTTSFQAQVLVPFTTVNFTAGSEGSVTVTTLKFTRTGIAADANLDNTYLYEGDAKLLEGGTLSSKVVTFNDASGIFTVPAGETKSITLKGNLNSAASAGKTIGFSLVSADDITSDASAVSGTFPASGNLMTVATADDLGYAMITGYTVPTTPATISPQDDYMVWKFTLTANQQNLDLEKIIFSEVGSINVDDLQNFELYYGGTLLGTAEMDSNNQVIFDLSDSPYRITKGQSRVLKLYADIVKGSNRTFKFTVQYPTDLIIEDVNYGVYAPSYITIGTWSIVQPDESYTIDVGTLSVTKRTDSPVNNVSLDGTNISLAKFDFKAAGEDIKITSLRVAADTVRTGATPSTANGLDNGMVYLDGTQVGSTKDIEEYASGAAGEGTSFTFGTSFIVAVGTTSVVEIKADVKDTDTNSFVATNTLQIYLLNDNSYNNAQGQSSLTILDVPASDKSANSLTVEAGALTFTKRAAYGNQTATAPSSEFKIGSFSALAGSTEGVNVDSVTVTLIAAEVADTENLLLKIGADQIGSTKVSPSLTNLFSINVDLAASESKTIDIYADILSTAEATDTINADVTGTSTTTVTSAAANASSVTLQTITVAAGRLSVNIASDNPDDALVVGLSPDVVITKYEFSSSFEAFNISEVTVYASSEQDRTAPRLAKPNFRDFLNVWLSYPDSTGTTVTTSKRSTFVNGAMQFTGLTMYVPAGSTAKLTVYADLNAVAPAGYYARTGDRPQISLAYYKANSGSIASFERRTGLLNYQGDGGTKIPITWVTATNDTGNDDANIQGTYALKFTNTSNTTGSGDGAMYDIPISDLNLTIADITGAGDTITFNAQSTVTNEGPLFTLYMDCDEDGAFDGEILYNAAYTLVANTWTEITVNSASSVTWWSNSAANTCAVADPPSTTTLGAFDDDVQIVGMSFSQGWTSDTEGASYFGDMIKINGTVYYSVEDDMGELGTNFVLDKTKPTVSLEGAVSGSLTVGTKTLYSLNVAADTKGDVGLKSIRFAVTATDSSDVDNLKFYKGLTDYTTKVTINSAVDVGGDDLKSNDLTGSDGAESDVFVVFTNEEVITGGTSQIYYLKARIGAVDGITSGDMVATYIVDDAYAWDETNDTMHTNIKDIGLGDNYQTGIGNFIWTDRSYGAGHSTGSTSLDWVNGFLVEALGDAVVFTLSKI